MTISTEHQNVLKSPGILSLFLARDAFVKTNRRAIVMMFFRLSV